MFYFAIKGYLSGSRLRRDRTRCKKVWRTPARKTKVKHLVNSILACIKDRLKFNIRLNFNLVNYNAIFFSDFLYKGICCGYSFELHRLVDAIQMSTHNICLYKEVKKKYIGCNLKTTEFLDCALIGVCAVIRSNTVLWVLIRRALLRLF